MRVIAIEEHFCDVAVRGASLCNLQAESPFFAELGQRHDLSYNPLPEVETDLGGGRIADMDKNGISMQVLSSLTSQFLPRACAYELVHAANERLAEAIRRYPARFSGFASVPTSDPDAAVQELRQRAVETGFVGAIIFGRTNGEFLDEPAYDGILKTAAELHMPLYLHPGCPPKAVTDACYGGLDPLVTARLSTPAWGWHQETAVHFLHLVLSGVFDRYPTLQIILGHWGEMVPFYLDRLDEALPQKLTGLERTVSDYVRQNVLITPSGMFSQAQLEYCIKVLGAGRILFSVDYPYIGNEGALPFLEAAAISQADKERIAHQNAERFLGISAEI